MNRFSNFTAVRRWRSAMRDDSGVSAVLIAMLVVMVVIPISAIAVDLSNGYANRRQMQNAADAAVMAATDAFSVSRTGGSAIRTAAERVAEANGNANVTRCAFVEVFDETGKLLEEPKEVAPCDGSPGKATGILVTTNRSIGTFFAPAMPGGGPEETAASATAVASLQKLVGGWAPLAVCAYFDPKGDNSDKVDWPASDDLKMLLDTGEINPDAIGLKFPLWGIGQYNNSKCNSDSKSMDWSGWICGNGSNAKPADGGEGCYMELPGDVSITSGKRTGPLTTVLGEQGCDMDNLGETPCTLALPICDKRTSNEMHCLTWGSFRLTLEDKNHVLYAELLGPARVTNGVGGTGPIGTNDAVVIGLVG